MKKWKDIVKENEYTILDPLKKQELREAYVNRLIEEQDPNISEEKKKEVREEFYTYAEQIEAPQTEFGYEDPELEMLRRRTQPPPKPELTGEEKLQRDLSRMGSRYIEALDRGLGESVVGLYSQEPGQEMLPFQPYGTLEKLLHGVGAIAGDMPTFTLGSLAGLITGPAAPIVSPTLAFGLTEALRHTGRERLQNTDTWEAIKGAALPTLKGMVTGAVLGTTGKVLGIAEKAAMARGRPILSRAIRYARTPAEIATLTTVPAAMEGHLPKREDFFDAAILLVGLKGAHKISGKLQAAALKLKKSPLDVATDIRERLKVEDVDVPVEIANKSLDQIISETGVPSKVKTKNYEFLQQMQRGKKIIGEREYRENVERYDYRKSNEILSSLDQELVLSDTIESVRTKKTKPMVTKEAIQGSIAEIPYAEIKARLLTGDQFQVKKKIGDPTKSYLKVYSNRSFSPLIEVSESFKGKHSRRVKFSELYPTDKPHRFIYVPERAGMLNVERGVPIENFVRNQPYSRIEPTNRVMENIRINIEKALDIHADNYFTKDIVRMILGGDETLSGYGSSHKMIDPRTNKHGSQMPLWETEFNILKGDARNLPDRKLTAWFRNPYRTFDIIGQPVKKLIFWNTKNAETLGRIEVLKLGKSVREVKKSLGWSPLKGWIGTKIDGRTPSQRIGIYAIAQQEHGIKILDKMGIRKIPVLEPAEIKAYEFMRTKYKDFYERINAMRILAGKEPFGKVENYFTFVRNVNEAINVLGLDIVQIKKSGYTEGLGKKASVSFEDYHPRMTKFKYAKRRVENMIKLEIESFDIFERYSHSAIDHIHISPVVAKIRKMCNVINDGKKRFSLKEEAPGMYDFLQRYADTIAGKKDPQADLKMTHNLSRIRDGLDKLRNNITVAYLSGALRTAAIQPVAIVQAMVETGKSNTVWALGKMFDPRKNMQGMRAREYAIKNSSVLLTRIFDESVRKYTGIGKVVGLRDKVARGGLYPLLVLDKETAITTWLSGFKQGKLDMKLTNREAHRHADDVVLKTQASGMKSDIAPVQRNAIGKFLGIFQTFVINNWGFLTSDVLGIKNARITNKKALGKTLSYVALSTLANVLYEDVFHMHSPLPDPVREFVKQREKDKNVPESLLMAGVEAGSVLPYVGGGIRFGSSPLGAGVQLIRDIGTKMLMPSRGRPIGELIGTIAGIPGTRQIYKVMRKKKKKKTFGVRKF